jgi:hypothetical protein
MGRVVTPKYSLEVEVAGPFRVTPAAWRAEYGRPNCITLAKYVETFEASTRPGGANAHLGPTTVVSARIRRNVPGGAVIAIFYRHDREHREATFEAWERGE